MMIPSKSNRALGLNSNVVAVCKVDLSGLTQFGPDKRKGEASCQVSFLHLFGLHFSILLQSAKRNSLGPGGNPVRKVEG
jgi:hypothetical protein